MSVSDSCKLISQNLTHNLRLAKTDEERVGYLTSALAAFVEQVIPPLNQLFVLKGEGNPELGRARTAALDLATFLCGDLVRKSADYRAAITAIEAVSDGCREPQMKSKLVFYTNQLKKRWNVIEPGGLAHNPRAKKYRAEVRNESQLANTLILMLFIGFVLFVLVRTDLTAVFPATKRSQPAEQLPPSSLSGNQQEQAAEQPRENPPQQPARTAGALYTYTDKQGVVHMVDVLDKVPVEYRREMIVDANSSADTATTPVVIRGDQVIVPVTLVFHGRSVQTHLLLDTGATVTTISDAVASQLGVSSSDVKSGTSTVADGRIVRSHRFSVDSLAVADHVLTNADTSILPGSGGKGYDGLLGMNFLRKFRYHVNFEKHVIEWGG